MLIFILQDLSSYKSCTVSFYIEYHSFMWVVHVYLPVSVVDVVVVFFFSQFMLKSALLANSNFRKWEGP